MLGSKPRISCLGFVVLALGLAVACDKTTTPTSPTSTPVVTPAPVTGADPANPTSVNLFSLTVDPWATVGGNPIAATLTLDGPAPSGGAVVTITSSTIDARPPATVTIPAGQRSVVFTIVTAGVSNPSEIIITAIYGGQSKWVQIRLIGPNGQSGTEPPVPGGGGAPASFFISSNLSPFVLLGGSAVTCTTSTITGDVGVSPGTSFTNNSCPIVGTVRSTADAAVAQADLALLYGNLGQACVPIAGVLDGVILTPGVYCVGAATTNLMTTLTLSGSGTFILRFASTLITATGSNVALINGATCGGVAYQVGSSATIGGMLQGNVVALTAITLNPAASIIGRALARNAAVTISTSPVSNAGC